MDAAQNASLVHHAVHGGVEGVPHRFLTGSSDAAPNVHAPFLVHALRQSGHPELAPRDSDFGGPSCVVDEALHFPNPIPSVVGTLRIHDEVVQGSPRSGAEAHGVDAVVVGAEPNAKLVRVLHAVADAELLQNGIWCGVVHLCCDVQVLVVVGDPHFRAVRGQALRVGAALGEVGGAGRGAPQGLVEAAVDHGCIAGSKCLGDLVPKVVRGLCQGPARPQHPHPHEA